MTPRNDGNAGAGRKMLFLALNSLPLPVEGRQHLLGAISLGRMRPPQIPPPPRWGLQPPALLSTPGFIN